MKHLLVVLVALLPALGNAATITTQDNIITVKGSITSYDVKKMEKELTDDITEIKLESNGGDWVAGVEISDMIKEKNIMTTAVGDCLSACATIWLSGDTHHQGPKDSIGFHVYYVSSDEAIIKYEKLYGIKGLEKFYKQSTLDFVIKNEKYIKNKGSIMLFMKGIMENGIMNTDMWRPSEGDLIAMEGPWANG